ncbi:PREDICTED: keratin-associated protein 10-3-like [Galeopterus variegatus]|uniref:Keratin-associated protein 10-3-like n=1 Tax=Galeopterus variegatus TaxID=482537 RepID=A0ABM0RM22_GALVR|nr:PREDICTED: keratin-associated protein 10-3-like [Galeopterus variegatus]
MAMSTESALALAPTTPGSSLAVVCCASSPCQQDCCVPVCSKTIFCKPVCCMPVCYKPACCKPICCVPVCSGASSLCCQQSSYLWLETEEEAEAPECETDIV